MVDYDYMSDGGKGWFADIDALTKALPRADRAKVFLCLHGWYDWVGRYCFDVKTGHFDQQWTVFRNYKAYKDRHNALTMDGRSFDFGSRGCRPVQLTVANVHERLAYAKSRGFRVGLYFADGMQSCKGLADFSLRRVLLAGGWEGPDTSGASYCQNPLVPEVRQFYLTYADALLAEFAGQVDAFVWDETFWPPEGKFGSAAVPGYADRAMMRLVREVAKKVEDGNRQRHRQTALLTSDNLGVNGWVPCALMGHGTYQDSWCKPQAWSYGIFPNYRNTMWSCCWFPVNLWKWIEFGVHQYQGPVSLSNGWGDDAGFAELSPEMQHKVLVLFQWRKQQTTQLRAFTQLPVYH